MKTKLSEKQNRLLETAMIIILIVFALVSYFITKIINNGSKNTTTKNISIFVNGEKLTYVDGVKIDINVDRTFTIGDKNSDYNIIEIKNKKVRCIDSNCPDKICVNHGYLNSEVDNDIIVCAPHRVMITCQ